MSFMTDGFEPPTTEGLQLFYLINRCTKNVLLHNVIRYANRNTNENFDIISCDNLLLLAILSLLKLLLLIVAVIIIIINILLL